jgi:hypothetical protein|tara:strand:+ start:345 stop:629 length:285 start_codon:yes stop_codon:yes gene_type:complete
MKILETKINDIILNQKYFILICDNKKVMIDIIDGTVDIIIKTNEDEVVGYTYLEKNDLIKIIYKKEINEIIIPKKIYVNTKYNFNSESSESETI